MKLKTLIKTMTSIDDIQLVIISENHYSVYSRYDSRGAYYATDPIEIKRNILKKYENKEVSSIRPIYNSQCSRSLLMVVINADIDFETR